MCLAQRKAAAGYILSTRRLCGCRYSGSQVCLFLRNPKLLWLSIAIATAVSVLMTVLINSDGDSRRLSIVNSYVQLTLRSNREVVGLEYAYFSLSNRTPNAVSYVVDGNLEPFCSVIEQRFDSNIGRLIVTNHSWVRVGGPKMPLSLSAHSSVDFMVYYPTGLTGAVLVVPYLPAKSRLARTAENLKLRVMGKQAKPTNEYDSIKLKLPLPR